LAKSVNNTFIEHSFCYPVNTCDCFFVTLLPITCFLRHRDVLSVVTFFQNIHFGEFVTKVKMYLSLRLRVPVCLSVCPLVIIREELTGFSYYIIENFNKIYTLPVQLMPENDKADFT
jgi:hypothetical protein